MKLQQVASARELAHSLCASCVRLRACNGRQQERRRKGAKGKQGGRHSWHVCSGGHQAALCALRVPVGYRRSGVQKHPEAHLRRGKSSATRHVLHSSLHYWGRQ